MDESQNNNDLQNAIDGIVNAAAAPVVDDTLPMPPAEAGADVAEMAIPTLETPAIAEPGAELMNAEPEPISAEAIAPVEEPVIPEVAPEATAEVLPTVEESVMSMPETAAPVEMSSVKESMIADLLPLIDKVEIEADKKFDLYKQMIESKQDKTMVPAAYEAAKGIADEKARAEALLYLINVAE